jgi:phospholipid/cholesterol/gamma-HCH transport system substrate-binding protein
MENKAHALAAGLFALLLGAAALATLFWFGGKKEETLQYVVVTRQNVTGLNPQGQVRYRGIRVGKVRDIRLDREDPRNILILVEIDAAVPVTQGTMGKLAYQGLTGIAHVLLEETGTNPAPLARPKDGELPRIPMRPSLFEELSESAAGTMKQAQGFLNNANALLNEENRKRFGAVLANLESSTAQLNKLLADDRVQRLGSAIARFDDAAGNAKEAFAEARVLIPRVTALSEKIETMVGDPSSGGATATIANINELTQDLAVTARQLNRVLRLIEQSPSSLLLGPPAPTPGPGEPGFVAPTTVGKQP